MSVKKSYDFALENGVLLYKEDSNSEYKNSYENSLPEPFYHVIPEKDKKENEVDMICTGLLFSDQKTNAYHLYLLGFIGIPVK